MPAHSDCRKVEFGGDLLGGHSLLAPLDHVCLTTGEPGWQPLDRRLPLHPAAQLVEEGDDPRARDDRFPGECNLNRADQTAGAVGFDDEAQRTGTNCRKQLLMVKLGRDHQHRRARRPLRNAAHSEDAASGNIGVDENKAGFIKLGRLGRPRRIGDIGNNSDASA